MKIDHVHFYVRDALATKNWFTSYLGFKSISSISNSHTLMIAIAINNIHVKISSPLNSASPVADYLKFHPPGVADVAFQVQNIESIVAQANYLGVKVWQTPQIFQSRQGKIKYAQIGGWNCLRHTLIETNRPVTVPATVATNITNIDHIVLNVAAEQLIPAVNLYQNLFGLKTQQTFKIQTKRTGLASQALIAPSGGVQFNINEPTDPNSQIQQFIEANGGSGIQHLALATKHIIQTVTQLRSRGVGFLAVPPVYYRELKLKFKKLPVNLTESEWQAIADQQILVDSDTNSPESLLMQVFTPPIFPEPTFFLEFIERRNQAKGFGKGNFQALFEAVERQQL